MRATTLTLVMYTDDWINACLDRGRYPKAIRAVSLSYRAAYRMRIPRPIRLR